jgi:hypothetical protein
MDLLQFILAQFLCNFAPQLSDQKGLFAVLLFMQLTISTVET